METCVLNQSIQHTNTVIHKERPSDQVSIPDEQQHTFSLRRSGTTSLSDLIPKAAAALKTQQQLRQQQQQKETTTLQDATPIPTTTFGRALTRVKLQIQTKRLKERYLSHEWIRLALSLPVDISHINLHHYYYQKKERKLDKHNNIEPMSPPPSTTTTTTTCQNKNNHPIIDTILSPPSSPKPTLSNNNNNNHDNEDFIETTNKKDNNNNNNNNNNTTLLSPTTTTASLNDNDDDHIKKNPKNKNHHQGYYYYCNVVIPKVPTSRTEEIVTWYEWKLNNIKFSIEEIESKVDRLRKMKLQDKFTLSV